MENNVLVQKMAKILWDRKASDILVLDVRGLTVLCDYMVIASGRNANQVKALADDVDELMAEEGAVLRRSEGTQEGRWVVLDYATILVHIFHQEERAYYNLERLWLCTYMQTTVPDEANKEHFRQTHPNCILRDDISHPTHLWREHPRYEFYRKNLLSHNWVSFSEMDQQ